MFVKGDGSTFDLRINNSSGRVGVMAMSDDSSLISHDMVVIIQKHNLLI